MTAFTQNIVATFPSKLQVYALKPGGEQALMTSDNVTIGYDNLQMTGELLLNTLQTNDVILKNLLDSAITDRITFSGIIPEGRFAFGDALNEQFTVETELMYGEQQSRIILNFNVSNRKTSLSNTFDITGSGSISLRDDLGITRGTGLEDKISFQFFQNVQTKTY
jgi:hypothetical protein